MCFGGRLLNWYQSSLLRKPAKSKSKEMWWFTLYGYATLCVSLWPNERFVAFFRAVGITTWWRPNTRGTADPTVSPVTVSYEGFESEGDLKFLVLRRTDFTAVGCLAASFPSFLLAVWLLVRLPSSCCCFECCFQNEFSGLWCTVYIPLLLRCFLWKQPHICWANINKIWFVIVLFFHKFLTHNKFWKCIVFIMYVELI